MSADPTDQHYELASGQVLHVWRGKHGFSIWLNTEARDFDGLQLGSAASRESAIDNAIAALNEAQARLIKER